MTQKIFFCVVAGLLTGCLAAWAGRGEWPEPQQNPCLTAFQPLAGSMAAAPRIAATIDLGRSDASGTGVYNKNGVLETVLALVSGTLYGFGPDGVQRWVSHPPGLNFATITTQADFNSDGVMEVLLQAGRPAQPYGAAVMVNTADGSVVWRYDVEPMSYAWYLSAADYVPAMPGMEVAVLMQGYPPDAKFGYIALFGFDPGQPAPVQRWRFDFDQYTCFPSLLDTDLDGDGVREVVVECHSRMWIFDAVSGVVRQFLSWDVAPANIRSYGLVEFVDLDGNGLKDFLCIADFAQHHEVLLNRGGKLEKAWSHGWPESVTTGKVATASRRPAHGDVDGDGRLELALSMYNSENEQAWLLRVYDAVTGELKYRLPGCVIAGMHDVNGDGRPDLLVGKTDDPTKTCWSGMALYSLKDGAFATLWAADQAKPVAGAPEDALLVDMSAGLQSLVLEGDVVAAKAYAPPAPTQAALPTLPPLQGPAYPELLAADLAGDAVNELIVFRDNTAQVYGCKDKAFQKEGDYPSTCLPVCADLDGDGRRELVTANVATEGPPTVEVRSLAKDNAVLWKTTLPPPDRAGLPQPRKAYLRTVRFAGRATPDLYLWVGTPVVRSVALSGDDGHILWEKGEVPQSERYWGPSMNLAAAWDANSDGKEDLVFTNPDCYCVASGVDGGFLTGPAFPPKIFNQPSQGLYTFPAICASTGQHPLVCLLGGHYFQGGMSLDAQPAWYSLPEVGDNRCALEGLMPAPNGGWRLGFGRQNGKFACLDAETGKLLWEKDLQASASDAASCDVDGDGQAEFLFGDSHGRLHAVRDGGAAAIPLWTVDLGAAVGAPLAADMDGDGRSDLVVPVSDGRVLLLTRTE